MKDHARRPRLIPLIAIALAWGSAGCTTMTTVDRRIEQDPALFQSLSEKHRALVRQGKVAEGMSKEAVRLAWGSPHETRQGSSGGKSRETWVYYGSESVPVRSLGFGMGVGYGGYGRHGYGGYCGPAPFYDLSYDVAYRDYEAATVDFSNGRVTAWERRQ